LRSNIKINILLVLIIVLFQFTGCGEEAEVEYNYEFHSAQPVSIIGYNGHAMEPFIPRDGQYLFFNNSNEPSVNTNLYYGQRIDDCFGNPQIISAIEGEATEAPSISNSGNILYFHKKVNGVYSIYLVRR